MSEIKNRIEDLEKLIADLENKIEYYEIDESEFEEQYIGMLDSEGPVSVCGMNFDPSRILRELDPIAYNCGLSDYANCIELNEIEEYQDLNFDLEELETELSDLQDELDELELND